MSIFRMSEVKTETGHRSHASIYAAIRAGLFPTGVQIGQRSVGWPSQEVQAINEARIAGQTNDEIRALVNRLHAKRQDFAAPKSKAVAAQVALVIERIKTAPPPDTPKQPSPVVVVAASMGMMQAAFQNGSLK